MSIVLYIQLSYICEMKQSTNNKAQIKKTGFSIRTTDSFLKILAEVAEKKEMSKTEAIEHLVRLEYEKLIERKKS